MTVIIVSEGSMFIDTAVTIRNDNTNHVSYGIANKSFIYRNVVVGITGVIYGEYIAKWWVDNILPIIKSDSKFTIPNVLYEEWQKLINEYWVVDFIVMDWENDEMHWVNTSSTLLPSTMLISKIDFFAIGSGSPHAYYAYKHLTLRDTLRFVWNTCNSVGGDLIEYSHDKTLATDKRILVTSSGTMTRFNDSLAVLKLRKSWMMRKFIRWFSSIIFRKEYV